MSGHSKKTLYPMMISSPRRSDGPHRAALTGFVLIWFAVVLLATMSGSVLPGCLESEIEPKKLAHILDEGRDSRQLMKRDAHHIFALGRSSICSQHMSGSETLLKSLEEIPKVEPSESLRSQLASAMESRFEGQFPDIVAATSLLQRIDLQLRRKLDAFGSTYEKRLKEERKRALQQFEVADRVYLDRLVEAAQHVEGVDEVFFPDLIAWQDVLGEDSDLQRLTATRPRRSYCPSRGSVKKCAYAVLMLLVGAGVYHVATSDKI